MVTKNKVIDGDFHDMKVQKRGGRIVIRVLHEEDRILDHSHLQHYALVSTETFEKGYSLNRKGAWGGILLGPLGLLFGLEKKSHEINQVAVKFKDGKESLLVLDHKIYTYLMSQLKLTS